MKVTTESGALYEIRDGICTKTGHEGRVHGPFKVVVSRVVDNDVILWPQVYTSPEGEPTVGKRWYVAGFDTSWLTTTVVDVWHDAK